jgi:hypothetical protein
MEGAALRSISQAGAKVSVHYRHDDLEVMVVEIGARGVLTEPSLWGKSSWHLVVDGQATFERGESRWDVLPNETIRLEGYQPYTILNPCPERLKLLSVVVAGTGADLVMVS